ncbi:MAG: putative porin [Balneolales bacterium]
MFGSICVYPAQAQDQGVFDPTEEDDEQDGDSGLDEVLEEEVVISPVAPIKFSAFSSYQISTTDSLLRWELWSNPAEWRHYTAGNITYRLGGFGRNDGMILNGHEQRHQKVYHEGILFNDRVTGSMNTNRMPHHRFARVFERSQSINHETNYRNRRYYLTRPLTMINYDQGEANYRSTEGLLSRNIGRNTNVELTYWGKNDDGLYLNNGFDGRKASGSVFHHINDLFIAEATLLYNGLQLEEPHGYQVFDMNQFAFQRFNVSPVESQARSSTRNTLLNASVWYRPDEDSAVNSQFSAYKNSYRRFYFGSSDSTFYRVSTKGLLGRHWFKEGPLSLQLSLNADYSGIDEDSNRSLEIENWFTYSGRANGDFSITQYANISGWTNLSKRSDGYQDYELGTMFKLNLPFGISGHASYALGEDMPTIQYLYWDSNLYRGNTGLNNESSYRLEAGAEFRPSKTIGLGAKVYQKHIRDPIMLGIDSTFTQTRQYNSEGVEMFLSFNLTRLETDISLTYQNFSSDSPAGLDQQLGQSGSRIWSRASLFYKNYLFDRATFVKIGGYFLFSPNPYRTGTYYPEMDYWNSNSFSQAIPQFHRFDLEVSARVRTVMVLFRLENALNEVSQLGYFETANNPMPGRVFRFGIKWILRN